MMSFAPESNKFCNYTRNFFKFRLKQIIMTKKMQLATKTILLKLQNIQHFTEAMIMWEKTKDAQKQTRSYHNERKSFQGDYYCW